MLKRIIDAVVTFGVVVYFAFGGGLGKHAKTSEVINAARKAMG